MKHSLAISFLAASLLAACGGGGSDSPSTPADGTGSAPAPAPAPAPDTTPPSVTSFLPDAATGVARTTEISATFSEDLRAGTVTAANLRLTRAATPVAGTLAFDAATRKASFLPQQALDLLASYTVTAGTGLQDVAGNGLVAAQSWTFRTADGNWQAAHRLDGVSAVSSSPDVAIDGDANAVAVWTSQAGSGWYEIRAAVQSATAGWGAASTVSTPGGFNAFHPKVRVDPQGNGLALWTQTTGYSAGGTSLWSARYMKGQGWQPPVQVEAQIGDSQEVSLAVDAAGNAFAVFPKAVAPGQYANTDIWAARFTVAGGWQSASRLGSAANIGTYDQATQPQVVVDAAGNAYVLWVQTASSSPVWFTRYQVGAGWQAAVSLGATQLGDPYAPRLAVSAGGQAMALWNSFVYAGGPYRFDLWSSVLATPDGNWSTPALLESDDTGDAMGQAVVADGAGRFHAVWQQFASAYNSNILHRQYTPGTGWGSTETISAASGTYDQNRTPSLVADRNGNLMALWTVYASGYAGAQEGAFARRYVADEGWQAVTRINDAGSGTALSTALAVNESGMIAAAWMQPADFRSDGPISVNLLK